MACEWVQPPCKVKAGVPVALQAGCDTASDEAACAELSTFCVWFGAAGTTVASRRRRREDGASSCAFYESADRAPPACSQCCGSGYYASASVRARVMDVPTLLQRLPTAEIYSVMCYGGRAATQAIFQANFPQFGTTNVDYSRFHTVESTENVDFTATTNAEAIAFFESLPIWGTVQVAESFLAQFRTLCHDHSNEWCCAILSDDGGDGSGSGSGGAYATAVAQYREQCTDDGDAPNPQGAHCPSEPHPHPFII